MSPPLYTPYEPVADDFICAAVVLLILFAALLCLGWWFDTRLALEALTRTAPDPEPETELPPVHTGTDFGFLEDPQTIAARRQFLTTAAHINGTRS